MKYSKTISSIFKSISELLILLISMAGYVPKNATVVRTFAIVASMAFGLYLSHFQQNNFSLSVSYFFVCELLYIGFISAVLSKNGLRHLFIRNLGGEKDGYLAFEAILGVLFFHNAMSIGYIASANPGNLFAFVNKGLLLVFVTVMFISGFIIKILAAKAVTIEIYYWKDMFLGRKISDFIVSGPYKYFSNPMYGIGQIQAYATAIWYGSGYGLMAALLNQILIFTFYFLIEKKFINRVYQNNVPLQVK